MFKKIPYMLVLFAMFMASVQMYAQDPPPGCDVSNSDLTEVLESFNFGDKLITYSCDYDKCGKSPYIDNGSVASVTAGGKYDFYGKTGLYNTSYYSHAMRIFADFDKDGVFKGSDELLWTTGDSYLNDYKGTLAIPSYILPGKYRLRVITSEYTTTDAMYTGCGDMGYWAQAVDFVLQVKSGYDAGITAIINPVSPFSVGKYSVVVNAKNFGTKVISKMKINWSVNGAIQPAFQFNSGLKPGDNTDVNLGIFSFTYPPEGPFNPFVVRAWTSDVDGTIFDDNPSNNEVSQNLTPFLNDCGAIGFLGPSEGFGPGNTQVRARIRNYAPKPLTSVTINWKVDGVAQTPITVSGLNIKENQYQDVVVGYYTFYNKTPLGPFAVEVVTSNPNGVKDEDQTNDKYTGGIGPSLVAGKYTVGGYTPHFNNLTTAMSYLNAGGIFGQGKVTFEVRPGSYNGAIVLNNKPLNNNPIEITSSTGNPYDVVINASPSNKDNYVFMIDGLDNVIFKNISLQNNNTNYSLAGTVLRVNNGSVTLDRTVLFGVRNAPRDDSYNIIYATNSDISMVQCLTNGGSNPLYQSNGSHGSTPLFVSRCSFVDYSGSGIIYSGLGTAQINNNSFKWESGVNPNNGITVNGSAVIKSNTFEGIVGTGSPSDGIVKVLSNYGGIVYNKEDAVNSKKNDEQLLDYGDNLIIEGNNISGTNINGVYLNNVDAVVNRNYINISQAVQNSNALVYANNSSGWIANNMLLGNGLYAFNFQNCNNLNAIYNTVSLKGTRSAFYSNGSNFLAARNVVINNGSAANYELNAGAVKTFENLNYNASGKMGIINGTLYSSLAALQGAGYELRSNNALVTTETESNLHIRYYIPEILFGGQLFADNSIGNAIEAYDYDGEQRETYNAGSDEIFLKIVINRQSDGFIDCENSTTNSLTVSAEINYGAEETYQWYKDGLPINGQTEAVLYFPELKFLNSGVYYCIIKGPGKTIPVQSKPVAVYVSTPTVITQQPMTSSVTLGGLATLKFEAHVNGKNIEEAVNNYEVTVQWYKVVSETTANPVKDNQKVAGAKSNYLTIKNVANADLGKYFAVVQGLCATISTDTIEVTQELLDLTIVENPINLTNCENTDITLNVDATTKSSKTINYQWYKDGVILDDSNPAKVQGTKSKHLTIYGITKDDAGQYWAVASLAGTSVQSTSTQATISVNTLAVITVQPQAVTIKTNEQLSLAVELENMEEPGLKYQWYKDNKAIAGAVDFIYLVERSQLADAGEYYCKITNGCGDKLSDKVLVVVSNGGGTNDVAEVSKAGYSISTAMPNPVSTISNFKYTLSNDGHIKITLSDAQGQIITDLVNQFQSIGEYTAQINANNLVSGVYFIKMEVNGVVLVNKVIVSK
ncbi:MAG TPA: immunoglobulin domain-containing protein [Candidatus Kapabacteria bacterium]|nr:immunoglobulin domain-containing protein [Candidatus Kapabacteria bacterium]